MSILSSNKSKVAALAVLTLMAGLLLSSTAAGAADGKAVFMGEKCNLCHAVPTAEIEAKTKSEKMKGPALLEVTEETTAEWLTQFLKKEVELDGKTHKRDFKGTDEELKALVDWLLEQKSAA